MNFARSAYKTGGNMEKNEFRQNLLSRIENWANVIKHKVVIRGKFSEWIKIISGVIAIGQLLL